MITFSPEGFENNQSLSQLHMNMCVQYKNNEFFFLPTRFQLRIILMFDPCYKMSYNIAYFFGTTKNDFITIEFFIGELFEQS
jgi:hypothetical protein